MVGIFFSSIVAVGVLRYQICAPSVIIFLVLIYLATKIDSQVTTVVRCCSAGDLNEQKTKDG